MSQFDLMHTYIKSRRKSMNSEFTDRAKERTTVDIPKWLKVQIKGKGMTIAGALAEGWIAIHERQEANQTISDLRREMEEYRLNMVKYRDRWLATMPKNEQVTK